MTIRQKLKRADRVFVMVMGVEFWIKTTKGEIRELAKNLEGGWDRLSGDMIGDDLYVHVEPS